MASMESAHVDKRAANGASGRETHVITMTICDQLFGIPTEQVQDVHGMADITPVPLARSEIAGALNIRGKIVTAVDLRHRLSLPPRSDDDRYMSVVVDYMGDLYSLIIDSIGDVMSLPDDQFEKNPPTLDANWREVAVGVYRLDDRLMVMTNVDNLLGFAST